MVWRTELLNKLRVKVKKEVVMPFALFAFLFVLTVQTFLWQEFAFEATAAQLRQFVWSDPNKYHTELGSICNTLKDFKCSKKHFSELVKVNPFNRAALANLAIAQSQLAEWQEAKVKFESYFSIGGGAADVMFWYAQTIEATEGAENSLQWYYESLAISAATSASASAPNLQVLEKLVSVLLQLKRFNEAASAIASVHQGNINEGSVAFELFEQSLNLWESHQFQVADDLTLPSFFENQVYSGVRLSANSRWRVAILNFEFERVVISEDLINESFLRAPAEDKARTTLQTPFGTFEVTNMDVPEVFILGKSFKNVKASVCKECPIIIGRSIVDTFARTSQQKGAVTYLSLKQ
jgi:hypothetical protein